MVGAGASRPRAPGCPRRSSNGRTRSTPRPATGCAGDPLLELDPWQVAASVGALLHDAPVLLDARRLGERLLEVLLLRVEPVPLLEEGLEPLDEQVVAVDAHGL